MRTTNEVTPIEGYIGTQAEWSARVAADKSDWLIALENRGCLVEYWALRFPDTQEPHDRDEVYVIVEGEGEFDMNGERRPIGAGDLIFVPAGMPHRFTRYSDNLAMWIVFFGPQYDLRATQTVD